MKLRFIQQMQVNQKIYLIPFRKPTEEELTHLNTMVEKINEDFMQLVSKNRKIEKEVIINDIGGLIFNSSQAKDNFLIDEEIGLEELVNLIIQENEFKDLRVLKNLKTKTQSLICFFQIQL